MKEDEREREGEWSSGKKVSERESELAREREKKIKMDSGKNTKQGEKKGRERKKKVSRKKILFLADRNLVTGSFPSSNLWCIHFHPLFYPLSYSSLSLSLPHSHSERERERREDE